MTKSGRSPVPMRSRASLPLETVSTSNPSTSSRVWRYLRMLGSSSTTRIFSLSAIVLPREPQHSSDLFGDDYSTLIGKRKEKALPLPTTNNHHRINQSCVE